MEGLLQLGIELDAATLAAIGTAVSTGAGTVWAAFRSREKEQAALRVAEEKARQAAEIERRKAEDLEDDKKRGAWEKVVADKDVLIQTKDDRITELQKELSKKSDEHAKTIERLMDATIAKIEAMSQKAVESSAATAATMAEFTIAATELKTAVQRMTEKLGVS